MAGGSGGWSPTLYDQRQGALTSNRDYANQMAQYHQGVLRSGRDLTGRDLTAQSRAMHRQALGGFQNQIRQHTTAAQNRAQAQQPATLTPNWEGMQNRAQAQQPIAQPTQQPTQQSAMSNYLRQYSGQPNYFSGATTQQRPMQTTPGDWFWTGSGWANQPQQTQQPSSLAGWLRQQGYQF